jgi:putative copper resistance protein D
MDDWLSIAIRFALYVDLLLLVGLPAFALMNRTTLLSRSGPELNMRPLILGAAVMGLLISAASMLVLAKAMSGVEQFSELSQHVFEMILTGTDVGVAWVVRVVALAAIVIVAVAVQRHRVSLHSVLSALGAIALGTVAWSGHGAMDEGARRYPHLIADILHLFAAAVWIGALAAFAVLLRRAKTPSFDQLVGLSRALAGFATAGTLIVVTLIITGAVNYWLTAGLSLAPLVSSRYGLFLSAKLCLFVAMLGLAAANRYHLTPRLERSIERGETSTAVKALRNSLVLETGAALLILLLVAWLGVLSPSELL